MENKGCTIQLLGWPAIVIFIVFFLAKIFNLITWSWIWVFSPLWIPTVIALVFFILYLIILTIRTLWK